jgi:protein arginine kinase
MAKWYTGTGANSDIVLSTRVRLARNIKGIPYPNKMTEQQAQKVIDTVSEALSLISLKFTRTDMTGTDKNLLAQLIEERYISPNMAKSTIPSAVFISEDESISIMVNEEDHIRLQSIVPGFETKKAYEALLRLDDYLADRLDYAVSEKYGHLTTCLTNAGTGMRVSCMMHLPGVVECGISDKLFATIGKLGLTVRGMYGEGTKSAGNIYQISNQITLGRSESELIDNLDRTVQQIIEKEYMLREKLVEKKGIILEDCIMRSYGLLKNARVMQTKELMTLLSNLRIGIANGMIKDKTSADVNTLMVETTSPFLKGTHLEKDAERAKIIREKLA